ncbi:MAG: TerC/Alx family metal homeostasis membrane protein [Bacteroidota bacterium]|nr:TerC/Alx family metal homeostasis membrane protein [Bacteroidota bacterium]
MFLNLLDLDSKLLLYAAFGIIIIGFLIVDLGLLHKVPKKISTGSAFSQSLFWIAISVLFGLSILYYGGGTQPSLEFFSAYLTEKALSIDNIFVIILILRYFKIEEKYYHKILFWGILGAIVFRAVFIFTGVFLINQFHWILYIFGAFLMYSGIKLLLIKEDDEFNPEDSPVIKFARKYLKITRSNFNGQFIFKRNRKIYFTPLFLVIVLIESTDLIFALDSIPAVFAISQSEFILYTSNIFAVMGLRAMFFLMASVIDKFYLLQKGLSFILIFIGAKMLLEFINIDIPVYISFSFIICSIGFSILISLIWPKTEFKL